MKFSDSILIAVADDDVEMLEHLIRNDKVEVSQVDYSKRTLLHWAAQEGADEIAEWLLEKAPDLINLKEEDGQTSLRVAAGEGHVPMVLTLLRKGALLRSPGDLESDSAIAVARAYGHEEIEMILSIAEDNSALLFYPE